MVEVTMAVDSNLLCVIHPDHTIAIKQSIIESLIQLLGLVVQDILYLIECNAIFEHYFLFEIFKFLYLVQVLDDILGVAEVGVQNRSSVIVRCL